MYFHFKYLMTPKSGAVQKFRDKGEMESLCSGMEKIQLEDNIGKSTVHKHTQVVALTENLTSSS